MHPAPHAAIVAGKAAGPVPCLRAPWYAKRTQSQFWTLGLAAGPRAETGPQACATCFPKRTQFCAQREESEAATFRQANPISLAFPNCPVSAKPRRTLGIMTGVEI